MKIILTSDVELWSWNKNFERDVRIGVLKLVELAENEKIPVTLFISLSDKGYAQADYLENISKLINLLKSKYVSFGIHTHCKNLPIDYSNKSDNLIDYSEEETVKILGWYKKELEKIAGKKIYVHRAGGYHIPKLEVLNECFKKTKIKIDSSLLFREYSRPFNLKNMREIPPATNMKYSKKRIVWSPEQMSFKEIIGFYKDAKSKTDVLVINFHSFSVYGDLGFKKKIWYSMPKLVRLLLRPIINLQKNKMKKGKVISKTSKPSNNFVNLKRMIKFLKEDGCVFTGFNA
ncbi:hypothetical protein HYT23_03795 [Candidatus Pacearchaeota archaeon]|nr:hypothetical protein [Candidatus Pacearchaeota archaeon]